MAQRHRTGEGILRFNDIITLYHKEPATAPATGYVWTRNVIKGVQWSDHFDKSNETGKINVARYASITFPKGTFESLTLDARNEEDAIVYGEVTDTVNETSGTRLSDLLNKYQKAGRIATVNDNSNRTLLKNKKVVLK